MWNWRHIFENDLWIWLKKKAASVTHHGFVSASPSILNSHNWSCETLLGVTEILGLDLKDCEIIKVYHFTFLPAKCDSVSKYLSAFHVNTLKNFCYFWLVYTGNSFSSQLMMVHMLHVLIGCLSIKYLSMPFV